MKKGCIFFLLIVVFLSNFNTVTTQDPVSGLFNALKSPKGLIMIYNKDKNNFRFEIECKDAIPFDAESMAFLIDKRFFQLVTVPLSEVIKNPRSEMTDTEILVSHKNFEMDYIYEVSGMNFSVKTDTIINHSKRKFLYWELNIPLTAKDTSSEIIKTKIYMNTLLDDEILALSMAVTVNDDQESAREFMRKIAHSFEHSEISYNVEQIADSLKMIK